MLSRNGSGKLNFVLVQIGFWKKEQRVPFDFAQGTVSTTLRSVENASS
jgi:hypothetical protein